MERLLDAYGSFRSNERGHECARGYSERGGLLSLEDTNYLLGCDGREARHKELFVTPNRSVSMKVP